MATDRPPGPVLILFPLILIPLIGIIASPSIIDDAEEEPAVLVMIPSSTKGTGDWLNSDGHIMELGMALERVRPQDINENETVLTSKWTAYYGRVADDLPFEDGASVCISLRPDFPEAPVLGATGSDIDAAWDFPSASPDSGSWTFNSTSSLIELGTAIQDARCVDTGQDGGFLTCVLKTSEDISKETLLFCAEIKDGEMIWNGETADFEIMVPTAYDSSTYEMHNFYVTLE